MGLDGVISTDTRLPPGRHGIAPELVIANQRERLLSAATEIFAEQGYVALTVSAITDRARVSSATFYELFEDKFDCIFAAYETAHDGLSLSLLDSCASHRSWPEGVAVTVAGALAFAAASPAQAQLLALAPTGAVDPRLTRHALVVNDHLLSLLRQGRERCSPASEPLRLTEQTLLLGAIHVIGAELLAGDPSQLPRMAPEIAQIILTPYLGGVEAKRVVLATGGRAT